MRKLLLIAITLVLTAGVGLATGASAAPRAAKTGFTCVLFQNPTVELVWSHVCHF